MLDRDTAIDCCGRRERSSRPRAREVYGRGRRRPSHAMYPASPSILPLSRNYGNTSLDPILSLPISALPLPRTSLPPLGHASRLSAISSQAQQLESPSVSSSCPSRSSKRERNPPSTRRRPSSAACPPSSPKEDRKRYGRALFRLRSEMDRMRVCSSCLTSDRRRRYRAYTSGLQRYPSARGIAWRVSSPSNLVSLEFDIRTGALGAVFATVATAPFDTIKTKRQIRPQEYTSVTRSISLIAARKGLVGFFEGALLRMARKAGSSAIAYSLYEGLLRRLQR